jgi:hypothetical protein
MAGNPLSLHYLLAFHRIGALLLGKKDDFALHFCVNFVNLQVTFSIQLRLNCHGLFDFCDLSNDVVNSGGESQTGA